MLSNFQTFVFITLFLIQVVIFAEDEKPFELTVEISEGNNTENWENAIFADILNKKKTETSEISETESEEKKENKTAKEEKKKKRVYTALKEKKIRTEEDDRKQAVPPAEKKEEEYSPASSNWGRYYGTVSEIGFPIDTKTKKTETVPQKKNVASEKPEIPAKKESDFLLDLVLSTNHNTEFDPMLNTGIRVSFAHLYSMLSVGTDYSVSSQKAYSLGITAGGFYKIHDFALKAGLGYKTIWDYTADSRFNDYSLGFEAGVSYNVFKWFALAAGTGVNYSVLKYSDFSSGKFVPTFFGALEFNLIR